MPSKRTNDSVDAILQELDHRQAAQAVQGGITERQVDDILRSVGMHEDHVPAGTFGPVDASALPADDLIGAGLPVAEDRFSTAALDDILADLPSVRSARAAAAPAAPVRPVTPARPAPTPRQADVPAPQPARPAPARPTPTPMQTAPVRQSEPVPPAAPVQPAAPQPAAPAAPTPGAPDLEDSTLNDTTRTSIIKNFLRKMGGEDADQSALNQGKSQFQHFFADSAAVLPDEKGRLKDPARKKRRFGLGSVEETDEFVPINVSLTAPSAGESYAPRMAKEGTAKRGLLARLFGGRGHARGEELYIPESREESAAPAPAAGVTFDDTGGIDLPDETLPEATMQLPKGSIRSKYTAGPGAGLSQTRSAPAIIPPEPQPPVQAEPVRPQPQAPAHTAAPRLQAAPQAAAAGERAQLSDTAILRGLAEAPVESTGELVLRTPSPRADDLDSLLPGESTLAFLQREMAGRGAARPAQPALQPQAPTVYRRAGAKPARRRFTSAPRGMTRPAPVDGPLPSAYGAEPVGEPLMTTRGDLPAAPAAPEPGHTGPTDTGSVYAEPPAAAPALTGQDYSELSFGGPIPAAPAYEEPAAYAPPAPAADAPSGFTVQMDLGGHTEDTAMFLSAYEQARGLRRSAAAAPAAPADGTDAADEPPTLERVPGQTPAPAAAPGPSGRSGTGEVRLDVAPAAGNVAEAAVSAARAAAQPSDFVRNIAQSINDETVNRPSIRLGDTTGDLPRDEDYYRTAAKVLADTNSDIPEKKPGAAPRLSGTPADETQETATMPPFTAAPRPTRHAYDKPDDAPAVHRDLARQVLVLTVSAIVSGAIALVLLYLGAAAMSGGWLPAALDVRAGKTPLLAVHLVLLVAAMGICWRTVAEGVMGLWRSPSPDTMPTLAAFGTLAQLVVLLVRSDRYDPARLGLMTGLAVLLLCLNTVGKALDARTLLGGFALVSAKVEHAVAYRLKDSSMLRAATRGLAEGRPCVLVSRPTELFKGFLNNAGAHRTSDKNQQQFAWALGVCALLALAFNLAYRRDVGLAVSAFAAVLCLGAPLAGTLISALPARLMQRSAARIGAVIPGWRDIRLLGRVNVIRVTARDLFPDGCVKLCGIKPVRKEDIDRAIIYAASMLAGGCPTLRDIFLGMIGDNRKLLAKVDDFETVYGKGYVGWIGGERVLVGNRALMEDYEIGLPSLEYEQKHTVNQRRVIYLAVAGKLFSMFQVAYQRDTDTAYVLDSLRRTGISLVVDAEDFSCDAVLLEAVYGLAPGAAKVLSAEERATLEPATAWLPESEGSMLHLGSFASFVGGLEAAAGAAEGERRASAILTGAVLIGCVLGLVLSVTGGIVSLPLPVMVLYQAAWAVLALVPPMLQHY